MSDSSFKRRQVLRNISLKHSRLCRQNHSIGFEHKDSTEKISPVGSQELKVFPEIPPKQRLGLYFKNIKMIFKSISGDYRNLMDVF